jgi:predicted Zn-ribbon and HTH transcriptional regulator
MEKEKLEALLIEYIDGTLSETERHAVERELSVNENAIKMYNELKEVMNVMQTSSRIEPSGKLKQGFEAFLQQELTSTRKNKTLLFQPSFYRVAAAIALLVVGGGVGFWISKQQRHADELAAVKKEMELTKKMMMAMLDNQQSASQRVLGATVAFNDIEKADDEIVNALIQAMNEDPNTNVRIAALEALGKFHNQPHVRKALIASLSTQKDPLVQIALIRLMVEMKEKNITKELERISNDNEALPAVKEEAQAGIFKLS